MVNFRPLRERNFSRLLHHHLLRLRGAVCRQHLVAALLQSLFGYDALSAGLVMSPAGFFAVIAMPFVGRALGRGADARWVIAAGLLDHGRGELLDVADEPGHQSGPGHLAARGADPRAGDVFAPANVAAYLYTPVALRGAAVGLLSLLRNEGGSVGTSLAQTMQERRDQFHTFRLGNGSIPSTRRRVLP